LNTDTGIRIKAMRVKLGLSQDQLSQESGISVRTIQRIETGKSVARGHSLLQISKALQIEVEELTSHQVTKNQKAEDFFKEDPRISFILILSAFSYLITPVLGVVLPGIIWIFYKTTTKGIFQTGLKMIQYELAFCGVIYFLYLYIFANKSFNLSLPVPHNPKLLVTFIAILYLINAIAIITVLFSWFKAHYRMQKPAL
jgi:transcriptional regulator with XRE-family HTH domain